MVATYMPSGLICVHIRHHNSKTIQKNKQQTYIIGIANDTDIHSSMNLITAIEKINSRTYKYNLGGTMSLSLASTAHPNSPIATGWW
jgi:hypothetical protein